MSDLKLFDDLERTDLEPSQRSESQFAFINRTARPQFIATREILEKWFSHYPLEEQQTFRRKFRSDLDQQHTAAFFELCLHETLLCLSCRVTLHHNVSPNTSKHPDFLAEPPDEKKIYLEATVVTGESIQEKGMRNTEKAVYDEIDQRVNSPNFFIGMNISGSPKTKPPIRQIVTFLQDRLDALKPDQFDNEPNDGLWDKLPRWHYFHDGWEIEFFPIPKKPSARGKPNVRPIGLQSYGMRASVSHEKLKKAIRKKVSRYGELKQPYIVAVDVLDHVDRTDIMNALFGDEQYVYQFTESDFEPPMMSRSHNGIWISPQGVVNTRLSAVLIAVQLLPWNISSSHLCLYHNPWAQYPYESVLNCFPQALGKDGRMTWLNGKSIGEVLGVTN
jgi:hypothetical protein